MDNALLCIPYNQTNKQKLFEKNNVKAEKKQTLQREKVDISAICVGHLA